MAGDILAILRDEEMARDALVVPRDIVVTPALELEHGGPHPCEVSESTAAQESLPEPRLESKVE